MEDLLAQYGASRNLLATVQVENTSDLRDAFLDVLDLAVCLDNKQRDQEPLHVFLKYSKSLSKADIFCFNAIV